MNEDTKLIEALNAGSAEAFDRVFVKYYPGLLRFSKTMLKYPRDEAEDIVTEVFCTIWKNRAQIVITGSLPSYLYAAVKNRVLDHFKKQRLLITDLFVKDNDAVIDHYLAPDRLIFYKELDQQLQYLIGKLPEKMRIVFQMNRNDGLTYEEIASILEISVNSVKTHMFRALKFLKAAHKLNNTFN